MPIGGTPGHDIPIDKFKLTTRNRERAERDRRQPDPNQQTCPVDVKSVSYGKR